LIEKEILERSSGTWNVTRRKDKLGVEKTVAILTRKRSSLAGQKTRISEKLKKKERERGNCQARKEKAFEAEKRSMSQREKTTLAGEKGWTRERRKSTKKGWKNLQNGQGRDILYSVEERSPMAGRETKATASLPKISGRRYEAGCEGEKKRRSTSRISTTPP